MKTYKLIIQEYNIKVNDYIIREQYVSTDDIYHTIGEIYCTSLVKIKRIDYIDISKNLIKENMVLKGVLKEVREKLDYYKNTEWGIKSFDILKSFKKILDKVGDIK